MNHQTPSSSANTGTHSDTAQAQPAPPSNASTGTFTQTAADLMRELHQLQAVVQSSSVLDFEAELNAALGKDVDASASPNGRASSSPRASETNGHQGHNVDEDGYEVVDDDCDAALASLNSDLETATRLLGLLDGKCDAMNARLDELLALMEEANDLGLDLDNADALATVTVSGGESALIAGQSEGDEVHAEEQATPPSN